MKYEKDPVVEETQKIRQAIFKSFQYNPHLLGKCLFELEKSPLGKKRLKQRARSSREFREQHV